MSGCLKKAKKPAADHYFGNKSNLPAFLCHTVKQRSELMATPERDTAYTNDGNRTVYTRESNGTGWFVGIIVVLALLAIGYLVFSANTGPATNADVTTAPTPAIEAPATPTTTPAPMTEAPAIPPATDVTPMTTAPATPAPDATPVTPTPATPAAPAAPAAAPAAPAN
jgi:cytoskeletal protein RodZ